MWAGPAPPQRGPHCPLSPAQGASGGCCPWAGEVRTGFLGLGLCVPSPRCALAGASLAAHHPQTPARRGARAAFRRSVQDHTRAPHSPAPA